MEILVGIAILGLVVALVLDKYFSHKERIDLIKMTKVKDLSEMEYVFGDNEVEEAEEESPYISLEEIE